MEGTFAFLDSSLDGLSPVVMLESLGRILDDRVIAKVQQGTA
jgi:hypothetical protein